MNFKTIYFEKNCFGLFLFSSPLSLYVLYLAFSPRAETTFCHLLVKIENIHLFFAVPEKLLHLLCRACKGVFMAARPTYNYNFRN